MISVCSVCACGSIDQTCRKWSLITHSLCLSKILDTIYLIPKVHNKSGHYFLDDIKCGRPYY